MLNLTAGNVNTECGTLISSDFAFVNQFFFSWLKEDDSGRKGFDGIDLRVSNLDKGFRNRRSIAR